MCFLIRTTRVVHAWWGTTSFALHRQTAPAPDFGEQWLGRGGPVNWPARSPDLNPLLHFSVWTHVKTLKYSSLIYELEVLQQQAENACQDIREKA
jgi:hypothetical protein